MTELQRIKLKLVDEIAQLEPDHQKRISRLVAKLCVVAIKDDRAVRAPGPDPIAKLFDVFFNGRPA